MELFPIDLCGINKRFGPVRALQDVSLSIAAGECVALLGENGAGKSTLMKILAGAEQPSDGSLRFAGTERTIANPQAAAAYGIHLCNQELQFVPGMTVLENLQLGRERTRFGWLSAQRGQLDDVIASLRELGFDRQENTPMGSLSVADRQLVSVAKGLREDVRLAILDEPTAALAPREVTKVLEMVRRLTEANKSVIYISHRLDEVHDVADRAFVLRDGRLVGEISPNASQEELVRMMVGREITNLYPHTQREPGEEVAKVTHLTARGIEDISLSVRAGEVVGVGGLVGSGQTQLAHALYGLNPPQSGEMLIEGNRYSPRSVPHALARGVGYLGDDRRGEGMVFGQSIFDNIALPAVRKFTPGGIVKSGPLRKRVEQFASRTRIKAHSLSKPMSSLSGGNQQKAVLARTLITDPRLVLLLEPTRGVDVGAKAEIYELLDELTERGMGILLISSDMPELMGLSDRILVMYKGRISGELSGEQMSADRIGELSTGYRGDHNDG
ncbi:sugar ABC transporter ATP-binding protein [Brachybacterium alimentarium]|uniref:sugar ABC transporter ATP-binding protein n=1 Tax=Brachybacterium alimentarium TaxID=47845 RepID=UPI003FD02BBD